MMRSAREASRTSSLVQGLRIISSMYLIRPGEIKMCYETEILSSSLRSKNYFENQMQLKIENVFDKKYILIFKSSGRNNVKY